MAFTLEEVTSQLSSHTDDTIAWDEVIDSLIQLSVMKKQGGAPVRKVSEEPKKSVPKIRLKTPQPVETFSSI